MEKPQFKALFDDVARGHGFLAAHGGWHRQFEGVLLILDLQRSNFGAYYELNLKLFLNSLSAAERIASKILVKSESGDIFVRPPETYRPAFDLEATLSALQRREKLDDLFRKWVLPVGEACASPAGILSLRDRGMIFLLPGVEKHLKKA